MVVASVDKVKSTFASSGADVTIVRPPEGEANYHVLYALVDGYDDRARLGLRPEELWEVEVVIRDPIPQPFGGR